MFDVSFFFSFCEKVFKWGKRNRALDEAEEVCLDEVIRMMKNVKPKVTHRYEEEVLKKSKISLNSTLKKKTTKKTKEKKT